MNPSSRQMTSFVTPWGLFEWIRILFELKNAHSEFQRYMEPVLADYHDKFYIPYLDDVINFIYQEGNQSEIVANMQKPKQAITLKPNQALSSKSVMWTELQKEALNMLIDALTSPPVMAYPEFDKPFALHTDASLEELGAVLYQRQDGIMHVIGYASKTLTPAEQNHNLHSGKLELLALKWAIL